MTKFTFALAFAFLMLCAFSVTSLVEQDHFDAPQVLIPYHQSTDTCTLCQDIVNIIRYQVVTVNSSISIIELLIKDICNMILIKPEREECLALDGAISNITKWIADGLDPKDICTKLHFCK